MFESLHKLLRVDSEPLENVEFMHISGEASGAGLANYSFLLHHFLSYFIKNSFRVCLVSCSQSLTQYKLIESKLGVNLERVANESQFTFVSLLTLLMEDSNTSKEKVDSYITHDPVSSIVSAVKDKLSPPTTSRQPCLLILDDLTALHDIGVTTSDILHMVCELKSGCTCVSTIVTTSLRLSESTHSEEAVSLDKQLSHWSELLFHVDELSTGLSKDVHGQLRIHRLNSLTSGKGDAETYHYKVTDRDVKLFAVGASPAVL
ncbi:ELP6 [Bugula neritina]|uniref:Elongator complex protein 6 n=1 Tax=Bugula neritina TaxID=10212 RepID=A0A7J7JET7_BUGNE|nr:ELP6 [Bugula neritina]